MKVGAGFAVATVLLATHAYARTNTQGAVPSSAAAAAQSPPPAAGKWSDAVEVVIHGPVVVTVHGMCRVDLWKVTRGDSVVWVLPTLLDAPRDMDWDTACVMKALTGAKGLLLQGTYTGVKASPGRLPPGQKLGDVVSPGTYARFKAAAWSLGYDPERSDHMRPGWAATPLVTIAYNALGLEQQTYPRNLPGLAHDAHVPIIRVTFDNGTKASRNSRNDLTPVEDEACLNAVLDRLDNMETRTSTVIDAWEKGDMPTLLANFYDHEGAACSPASRQGGGSENIAIWEDAINKALDGGGTNVAAVPINFLLYRNGVLDKLTADGASVAPPKGVVD